MKGYDLEYKYGLPYYWDKDDIKNCDYVSIINSIDSSILFSKLSELNREISNIARKFDDILMIFLFQLCTSVRYFQTYYLF